MSVPLGTPLDLHDGDGRAVLWGIETDDLNVNLVAWPPGEGVGEHVNAEVDVVLVVVTGDMTVCVGPRVNHVDQGQAIVVPKGEARAITAGVDGARYLTVHRRRRPLTLA